MPDKVQLLLPAVATPEDRELVADLAKGIRSFPGLREISEEKARFALCYLSAAPGVTMDDIAARAGVSLRQAFRFRGDPECRSAMTEVARQACGTEFTRLLVQVAGLAGQLGRDISDGKVRSLGDRGHQFLVNVALRLSALDLGGTLGLRVEAGGTAAEVRFTPGDARADAVATVLSLMRERVSGTPEAAGTLTAGQSVPGQAGTVDSAPVDASSGVNGEGAKAA